MKFTKFLLAVFLPAYINAQEYNVALIPDSLKENANAITRFEEVRVVVKSTSNAVFKHKYAITILNEAGDRYADYENGYSNLRDLNDISGTLYDAQGIKLKTIKRKDITDVSSSDGFSLMLDSREKSFSFNYNQYPYTVEYEDQVEMKGIITLPSWVPVGNQKYSVQESNYLVEVPADYNFRIKQFNFSSAPQKTEKDKRIQYSWQLKNFKAFKYEPFQPTYHEVVPSVYLAPNQFSYGGISGEMDSWLKYGKYQVELNKGRDILPEHIKKQVKQLTNGITDDKEKVRVLYEYMQKNTRYVSIQLGIGGLQPFDATYVATKNYGDCKALSNYMVALLKEVGINGYYSIIKAGEGEKFYMADFPSDQTNHIIVSVPMARDTMWLECTSQTTPAGYLGAFTDDRYALMIKEDGGYLVKTPAYKKDDNQQVRIIKAIIKEDGSLVADVDTKYTGIQQDDLHAAIHNYTKDKILEQLKKGLDFPTYDVSELVHEEHKAVIPWINERYKLAVENFGTTSGKRLFVSPNLLTKQTYKLDDLERKFEILYDHAYKDVDTIVLATPAGYTVEAMPKDVLTSNKFGNYSIKFKVENGNILVHRIHERSAARFPAADYKQFVSFVNEMYKADRSRIVFVKN